MDVKINKKNVIYSAIVGAVVMTLAPVNQIKSIFLGMIAIAGLRISSIDMKKRIIEDKDVISCGILWVVYILTLLITNNRFGNWMIELKTGLISSLLIGGTTLIVTLISEKIAKKELFGGGDIKILFVISLWFTLIENAIALMFACGICLLMILIAKAKKKLNSNTEIPFAPFIFMGYLLMIMLNLVNII